MEEEKLKISRLKGQYTIEMSIEYIPRTTIINLLRILKN